MNFTAAPFTILSKAFKNEPPQNVSCFIDNIQVPIEECGGVVREANLQVESLDFWDLECEIHPTNSHCKVYDD